MSEIRIVTNHVPRPVIRWYELTDKERKEFDYLDSEVSQGEAQFFRYKGQVYDLGEFSRVIAPGSKRCHPMECDNPAFQGWDGYQSDSFFSGILIRFPVDEITKETDYESVIVATYMS